MFNNKSILITVGAGSSASNACALLHRYQSKVIVYSRGGLAAGPPECIWSPAARGADGSVLRCLGLAPARARPRHLLMVLRRD